MSKHICGKEDELKTLYSEILTNRKYDKLILFLGVINFILYLYKGMVCGLFN